MLWGCSSGMLKDVGDHDPTGTPYHYLIAGWYVICSEILSLDPTDPVLLLE